MPEINVNVPMPQTPEEIWDVISDPKRYDEWLTIHAGWLEEPPAEIQVGSKLVQKVSMLGMANKIEWTVDAYEVNKGMSISGTGMAGVKAGFSFEVLPEGDGSVVSITSGFSGQLIVGALGKAVAKDATKNLEKSLANLTTLVAS